MALRRLAQQNNAASASPKTPDTPHLNSQPSTPRSRLTHAAYRSPASTPSISSSVPFDWEAARSRAPPPYATPLQKKSRNSGVGTPATPRRAVIRKKSLFERIMNLPSAIAFEIALFPHNVPLPAPQTSARLSAGVLHLFHLLVRISQIRRIPDSDLGWEDMYREGEGYSWFDWTVPVIFLCIFGSAMNAVYLFTRTKIYHLRLRSDLVSSPHATFVAGQVSRESEVQLSLGRRLLLLAWNTFSSSWRFLLGMKPRSSSAPPQGKTKPVQQLEVWTPGELQLELFSLYSPLHPLLWIATGSSNWMLMLLIMGLLSGLLNFLIRSYQQLLKDREIIAAEVMSEYNQIFVNPRVNPIRHDVAVMTHQAEIVNIWED